eukprot:Opistho-2@2367
MMGGTVESSDESGDPSTAHSIPNVNTVTEQTAVLSVGSSDAVSPTKAGPIESETPPEQSDGAPPSVGNEPSVVVAEGSMAISQAQQPSAEEQLLQQQPTTQQPTSHQHLPSEELQQSPDIYAVKRIPWSGRTVGIVTQNINGPCPLIAICNVLALRGQIQLHADMELVSYQHLCTALGDCLMRAASAPTTDAEHTGESEADRARNVEDCFNSFPKLQTGLDVNVRFSSVDGFEFTSECLVFDLLNIRLVHGWLPDPQDADSFAVISKTSYNQLVERVISYRSLATDKGKGAEDPANDADRILQEGIIAEAFLEQSASQLTYHGIAELASSLRPNQPCVLFRNNHFSTLLKHRDELMILATDQGFLHSPAVWETVANVEGDGVFLDGEFHNIPPASSDDYRAAAAPATVAEASAQNADYLLALSLQRQEDEAERQSAQQQPQQQHQQSRPTSASDRGPASHTPSQRSLSGNATSAQTASTASMDPDYLLALQLQEEDDRRAREDQRARQQQQQPQQQSQQQQRQQQRSASGGQVTASVQSV